MSCGRGRIFYPYERRPMEVEYPRQNPLKPMESRSESAIEILNKRLANGEISPEQYAEMLMVISGKELKIKSTEHSRKVLADQKRNEEQSVNPVVKKIKKINLDGNLPSVSLNKKRKA